jgi:ABC-2 type transport system ATP-binding protein
MSEPVISLQSLGKRLRDTIAVAGLSLEIEAGEIFAFLGANGAGKTTTIRMLCGLTKPTQGRGFIKGFNIWKDRFRIRSLFGYVPQRLSLYGDLTVLENLRFFGGAYGLSKRHLRERIEALIADFGLASETHSPAGRLSGGFKQLLSIACALIHEPSVLFLDEPTAGLDPEHRQHIWDLLYELSQQGTTIIGTTHYMDEAERCTDVGFIDRGELLAKGSPRVLKEQLHGKVIELEVEPLMIAMRKLRKLPTIQRVDLRNGKLRLHAKNPENLFKQLQQEWPFPDLQWLGHNWVEPDMEDVFKTYAQGIYAAR